MYACSRGFIYNFRQKCILSHIRRNSIQSIKACSHVGNFFFSKKNTFQRKEKTGTLREKSQTVMSR